MVLFHVNFDFWVVKESITLLQASTVALYDYTIFLQQLELCAL